MTWSIHPKLKINSLGPKLEGDSFFNKNKRKKIISICVIFISKEEEALRNRKMVRRGKNFFFWGESKNFLKTEDRLSLAKINNMSDHPIFLPLKLLEERNEVDLPVN